MVEAFSRVAEGKAKWTDELVLTKEKKVGGAGILPEFTDGLRLTLRDGVTLMMVLSDNTATNLVIDVLTADAVNARMESLGLKETRLMRRVFGGGESVEGRKEENKRFGLGRTSPREMVTLMEKAGTWRDPQPRRFQRDARTHEARAGHERNLARTMARTESDKVRRARCSAQQRRHHLSSARTHRDGSHMQRNAGCELDGRQPGAIADVAIVGDCD